MAERSPILKLLSDEFSSFSIKLNDFQKEKLIGKGGYAEVWLAVNKKTGEHVALKQLYQAITPKQARSFAREIRTMSYGNHPFFLRFIGFSADSTLTLASEYMVNGSLFRFLRSGHRRDRLNGTHRTLIAMGIAHAMNHLHSLNIIHRDLKSMNILLDGNYLPRLCDFGIARFLDPTEVMTTHIGTPHWMAPEILNGEKYGKSVDVYSFAMLLYELLTNAIPWSGLEPASFIKKVCSDKARPKLPEDSPDPIRKLIQLCWSQNPDKRPTFAGLYHIFKSGQVEFPGTDASKVALLDKKLKKIETTMKLSDLKKNRGSQETFIIHQSSSSDETKGSYTQAPVKIDSFKKGAIKQQQSHHKMEKAQNKKFTAEVVYDQFTETEESNSAIIRQDSGIILGKNDANANKPSLNLLNLQDPKNPHFFAEMQKAQGSLSQSQAKEFFSIIANFMNSNLVDNKILFQILEALLPILSNKIAVDAFAELEVQTKLPLSNTFLLDPCLALLFKLFSENPWIFQNNFHDQMVFLIQNVPHKAIILLAHFAKASSTLENCWDLLDLMIRRGDLFFKAKVGHELISILYNLCISNDDYRTYRLQFCLNVFRKGIESDDGDTVSISYNSMAKFFSDSMEFDQLTLIKHLGNEATMEAALSILIRLKHIPRDEQMIDALLDAAKTYEAATFCLIRIVSKIDGAKYLADDVSWAASGMPNSENTFQLFAAVFYHPELRYLLITSKYTITLFKNIFELKRSDFLIAFSILVQSTDLSKEDIEMLQNRHMFANFFETANEIHDESSAKASIEIIRYLANVQFIPESLSALEPIIQAILKRPKLANRAIPAFVAMSQWPKAVKKMKKLGFDQIINDNFGSDPKLVRYTKKLIAKIQ